MNFIRCDSGNIWRAIGPTTGLLELVVQRGINAGWVGAIGAVPAPQLVRERDNVPATVLAFLLEW